MGGTADAPARQPFHAVPPQITPLVLDVAWSSGEAVRYIVYENMDLDSVSRVEIRHDVLPRPLEKLLRRVLCQPKQMPDGACSTLELLVGVPDVGGDFP